QSRIAEASAAVAESEDAIDSFISQNISGIADEAGRRELETLFSEVGLANNQRARLSAMVDTADAGLRRRDWNAVAESLQSEALRQLEMRRLVVASSLEAAAAGSQAAIDLRA